MSKNKEDKELKDWTYDDWKELKQEEEQNLKVLNFFAQYGGRVVH